MALWSFKCGKKGVSRVRVYERANSPCIYVEWHRNGKRLQRVLRSKPDNDPVTNRADARRIALAMSAEMERERNRNATMQFLGLTDHTVGALLKAMHAGRAPKWSASHKRDQERYRDFWMHHLGPKTKLTDVNAALVESIAQRESDGWSPATHRHYLRYIRAAFRYAERKLKWIGPRHNLSAVDLPSPKSQSKPYSLAEVRKLLPALEKVSPRAGWIGHVLFQTGRRLTATRTLPAECIEVRDGYTVLHYPSETDKAKQSGDVPVVGRAHELSREIADWSPVSMEQAQAWLVEAEKIAKVPHVKGRLWHAFKRRWATESRGLVSRDKMAGTLEQTLRHIYEQDDLAPKLEVAKAMAERL